MFTAFTTTKKGSDFCLSTARSLQPTKLKSVPARESFYYIYYQAFPEYLLMGNLEGTEQ